VEIVCLQNGNDGTPAYCLPTTAGTLESYYRLAKAIGPRHLLYGIQFADRLQSGKFMEFASLQEMAVAMIPGLLAHHGDGPFCLIGHSFGGFLAIELAQQLVSRGRHVPLVVMIVARGPSLSFVRLSRLNSFVRNVGPWALRVATRVVANAQYRSMYREKFKLTRPHKFAATSWYQSLPKDHQDYVTNNDANLRKYRFEGAYRGKILLIRKSFSPESDTHPLRFDHLKDYGWGDATGASVDIVCTPDDPTSMLYRNDVVDIANALRAVLSECDRGMKSNREQVENFICGSVPSATLRQNEFSSDP
jgi:thioesterase domain-containing protein